MPFLSIREHQFHYTESGHDGHSILMLHSTGIGAWQWQQYSRLLAPRKTMALDLLGYHPSESWRGPEAPDCHIDFLAAEQLLLSQEGLVDVIGHSYGGFLAMKLAKKHPNVVSSLLLHEPVAWGVLYDGKQQELQDSFTQLCQDLFADGPQIDPNIWLNRFVDYWNTPGTWLALPSKTKHLWINRFAKIYAEVIWLCQDRTPLSHWTSLPQPICITCSHDSPPHEREICFLLSDALPNVELFQHRGDHLSPLTHFEELSDRISLWFQSSTI